VNELKKFANLRENLAHFKAPRECRSSDF